MALPITHIRFALDFKDKYKISNLSYYLSGAIYPDSRYLTGIDRVLTHNDQILDKDWADTDFKKGWQSHCLCDLAHISTALKIIQDMDDSKKFIVKNYLVYLDYANNPNSEYLDRIKQYNQLIINMYSVGREVSLNDYKNLCLEFKLDPGVVDNVLIKTAELLKDKDVVYRVGNLYELTLEIAGSL